MLGKRSRPSISIGKIAGAALRSAGIVDSSTSPRSPLDCTSPRSQKYFDQQGGIGLGIVVALNNNNSSNSGGEILAKYALCFQFSCQSNPVPMNNYSGRNVSHDFATKDDLIDEEFTYVTYHGPKQSITTRVYHNVADFGHLKDRTINNNIGVFKISSPARLFGRCDSDSDFLSSCNLCRKTLQGKDIYMYRGEKAFCSEGCREKQISIEEKREKRRSETSRSGNVSSSPCSYASRGGQIFSNGIVAI